MSNFPRRLKRRGRRRRGDGLTCRCSGRPAARPAAEPERKCNAVTDFSEAYQKVLPTVVGIGFCDAGSMLVIGTGFIVHPHGWVISNRHVLTELLVAPPDVNSGVRPDANVFVFVGAPSEGGLSPIQGIIAIGVSELAFHPEAAESIQKNELPRIRGLLPTQVLGPIAPDIGVCKFNPAALPSNTSPIQWTRPSDSSSVREGMPIGILGFPLGMTYSLGKMNRVEFQAAPILQTGVIAARLPLSAAPDFFLLDVVVNPGSSGSPLFLANGDIVGIVFATRQRPSPVLGPEQQTEGVSCVAVPTSLGYAIPSARFPKGWVQ